VWCDDLSGSEQLEGPFLVQGLALDGWQGAAVLGLDGVAGWGGDLVNPFAVLFAPAEFYRAVHGRQAALRPGQTVD
jgi:hypothetical protein